MLAFIICYILFCLMICRSFVLRDNMDDIEFLEEMKGEEKKEEGNSISL